MVVANSAQNPGFAEHVKWAIPAKRGGQPSEVALRQFGCALPKQAMYLDKCSSSMAAWPLADLNHR